MREIPALFSAPMVLANLRPVEPKDVTRRVLKIPDTMYPETLELDADRMPHAVVKATSCMAAIACPYGDPGDRLWMRENFWHWGHWEPTGKRTITGREEMHFVPAGDHIIHVADHPDKPTSIPRPASLVDDWHHRPSIFMPRKACRALLEVVSRHVEPLHDITEADAKAEGILCPMFPDDVHSATFKFAYQRLWQTLNGPHSWEANPLVWVVRYKRVQMA